MVEEAGKVEGVTASICQWADLVLCTGSTICNGIIVDFLHLKDKILFYGTTLAGAAKAYGPSPAVFCGPVSAENDIAKLMTYGLNGISDLIYF